MNGPFVIRDQGFDALADKFIAPITKHLLRCGIDQGNASVGIDFKNGVGRSFQ